MLKIIFIVLCFFAYAIYCIYDYCKDKVKSEKPNSKRQSTKRRKLPYFLIPIIAIGVVFISTVITDTFSNMFSDIRDFLDSIDPFVTKEEYIQGMEIITGVGEASLEIGEETKLSYSISPSEASDYKLVWTSSNPSAIEVDNDGTIKAKSQGMAEVTVGFKNFSDLPSVNMIIYSFDPELNSKHDITVTYDHISPTQSDNENWYIFFNIDNQNHLYIKECKVEVYDINGTMIDSQTANSDVMSNFAGTFKLTRYTHYFFVGTVATTDGIEYKSEPTIIADLPVS